MFKKSIPNIVTSGNLAFGFLAIILAAEGFHKHAVLSILFGMLLDTMDGRLARILGAEGDFGKELDSLADVVTFGVAPAFILYQFCLTDLPPVAAAIISCLFPVFGAWRLARFNITHAKIYHYFVGLPITAAGGILSIVSMLNHYFTSPMYIMITLVLAFLMVSSIKHPNFKKIPFPKHTVYVAPFLAITVFVLQKYTPFTIPILTGLVGGLYVAIIGIQMQYKKRKNGLALEEDEDECEKTP